MSIRDHRVGRSRQEKNAYLNAIKNTASGATVVEKSSILPSDQEGEDESVVTNNSKRPVDNTREIIDWLKTNWIKSTLGIIALAGLYFINDSKNSIYRIDSTIQEQGGAISQVQIEVRELSKKGQDQDLKIQRTEDKIDGLNQRFTDLIPTKNNK